MKQSPYVIYSKSHAKLLKTKSPRALARKKAASQIYQLLPWGVLVKPASDINGVSK